MPMILQRPGACFAITVSSPMKGLHPPDPAGFCHQNVNRPSPFAARCVPPLFLGRVKQPSPDLLNIFRNGPACLFAVGTQMEGQVSTIVTATANDCSLAL